MAKIKVYFSLDLDVLGDYIEADALDGELDWDDSLPDEDAFDRADLAAFRTGYDITCYRAVKMPDGRVCIALARSTNYVSIKDTAKDIPDYEPCDDPPFVEDRDAEQWEG